MSATKSLKKIVFWIAGVAILGFAILALARPAWTNGLRASIVKWIQPAESASESTKKEDSHAGLDHGTEGHEGHDHGSANAADMIEVSNNGLKNIGYRPITVKSETFEKSLTLPAIVVERPGHSQLQIPAPLTGVVTRIFPVEGAAIEPGSPLFEMKLTHEELVTAQRDFLKSAENLDVVNREIKRLEAVGDGVVAGKRILEQQYEQQKMEASFKAERQALILHGLSEAQIDEIHKTRKLLNSLTVYAPEHRHAEAGCTEQHLFHIQDLPVKLGQQVEAGQSLCILADHCLLYVEGRAFENDARNLRTALKEGWKITARPNVSEETNEEVASLEFLYIADHVEPETRSFRFYLRLPNAIAFRKTTDDDRQFIQWKYRPGQRLELQIPIERLESKIVLPIDAVVDEGAESYVFLQNGNRFNRVTVHVEYRDQTHAVVENNGSIFEGDVVAGKGAYQMQLALKNKSGGAIDPHAGHNH